MTAYGVDTWCLDEYTPGRFARGRHVVAQAIYRRLTTPRGMLRGGDDESAYGVDLSSYVGAVGGRTALAALPGIVRGELLKDDRIADVRVSAAIYSEPDGTSSIDLGVVADLVDDAEPLALTVRVSDATVTLLGGVS